MDLIKFFDDKIEAATAEVDLLKSAKDSLEGALSSARAEGKAEGVKEAEAAYQVPDPESPDAQYTQAQLADAVKNKESQVREELGAQLEAKDSEIAQVKESEAAVKADYDQFKEKSLLDRDAAVSAREEEIYAQYEASQVDDASFAAKIKTAKAKSEAEGEG